MTSSATRARSSAPAAGSRSRRRSGRARRSSKELEAWRSGLVQEGIDFLKASSKGESTAVRTGTPKGTSDVDISTFGRDAAQNVERVKEYLAKQRRGRARQAGVHARRRRGGRPRADAPPGRREGALGREHSAIEREAARHQESLVYNRRFYDAMAAADKDLAEKLAKEARRPRDRDRQGVEAAHAVRGRRARAPHGRLGEGARRDGAARRDRGREAAADRADGPRPVRGALDQPEHVRDRRLDPQNVTNRGRRQGERSRDPRARQRSWRGPRSRPPATRRSSARARSSTRRSPRSGRRGRQGHRQGAQGLRQARRARHPGAGPRRRGRRHQLVGDGHARRRPLQLGRARQDPELAREVAARGIPAVRAQVESQLARLSGSMEQGIKVLREQAALGAALTAEESRGWPRGSAPRPPRRRAATR